MAKYKGVAHNVNAKAEMTQKIGSYNGNCNIERGCRWRQLNLADRNTVYNICRALSYVFWRPYQRENACLNKGRKKENGALAETSFLNGRNKMPRGN